MTQNSAPGRDVPPLTLGWRLKMSLDYADISVQQIADTLGVSRATISRWMGDKGDRPKRAYLLQWALITRVPFEWIDIGVVTLAPDPDDDGGSRVDTQSLRPGNLVDFWTLRPSDTPAPPKVWERAA